VVFSLSLSLSLSFQHGCRSRVVSENRYQSWVTLLYRRALCSVRIKKKERGEGGEREGRQKPSALENKPILSTRMEKDVSRAQSTQEKKQKKNRRKKRTMSVPCTKKEKNKKKKEKRNRQRNVTRLRGVDMYARRQSKVFLAHYGPLNTNRARVTQLLWTSRRTFDIWVGDGWRKGGKTGNGKKIRLIISGLHRGANDTHGPSAEGWSRRERKESRSRIRRFDAESAGKRTSQRY